MTIMEPFRKLTSRTMVLAEDNIDTDQIIPARFLTTTSRENLGKAAFYDWRFDENGRAKGASIFEGAEPSARQILVAGRNFGCGSSREHATWALIDYGFRVVISSEIADIFASNALKNGLLPITLVDAEIQTLLAAPGAELTVDLVAQKVVMPDGAAVAFEIEAFARRCLLDGVDPLGHLISLTPAIEAFESRRG